MGEDRPAALIVVLGSGPSVVRVYGRQYAIETTSLVALSLRATCPTRRLSGLKAREIWVLVLKLVPLMSDYSSQQCLGSQPRPGILSDCTYGTLDLVWPQQR